MRRVYIELTKLVVITSFGRGALRPLRSAIIRVMLATIGALCLGIAVGRSLAGANLATGLPVLMISAGISTIAFAMSGFILLSAGSLTLQNSGSMVQKLLATLPLNKTARWFVLVLPLAIMSFILLCLYLPLAIGLGKYSGTPIIICLTSALFGTLASVGFVLIRLGSIALVKTGLFTFTVFAMIWLIDSAIKNQSPIASNMLLNFVLILATISYFGLIQSYQSPSLATVKNDNNNLWQITWPSWLVIPFWFILKTIRNRYAAAAYGFCLFVSLSLAIGLQLRQQVNLAGVGWLAFGSVLACSFASDTRGLSRRYKTPEIVALKGVNYFMLNQLVSALVLNIIIVIPLFIVVVLASPLTVGTLLLYTLGIVMAGTILGLLSSTIFVPQNGELGSQIFTALLAFAGLFGLPRVLKFTGHSLATQAFIWMGIASICFFGAIAIEKLRRRNYIHAGA